MCQLSLNGNDIHSTGVLYLADGVCTGKVALQGELSLHDNPLGIEGTVEVGRILSSSHCQLTRVSLHRCHLTTPGSSLSTLSCANLDINVDKPAPVSIIKQKVCHTLQNNAVKALFLDGNNFTGDGIHILAGLMHLCPCLTFLHSSHCGITSDDLKRLLESLTNYKDLPTLNNSKLEYWNLGNNEIDDDGAIALMDHLPSLFPNLGYSWIGPGVDFNGNHISSEIMRRTREEIKKTC